MSEAIEHASDEAPSSPEVRRDVRLHQLAILGVLAGTWVALSDYGSFWLWMTTWSDRGWLLVRILLIMGPIGAFVGLGLGAAARAREHARARYAWMSHRVYGRLPMVVVGAPVLLMVAIRLFGGGKMSRLPFKPLLIAVTFVVLGALAYGGVRAIQALIRRATASTPARRSISLIFAVAFFVFSKVNEHVYPNLYEFLHVALSVMGFAAAFAAVAVFTRPMFAKLPASRLARRAHVVLALASIGLVANLVTFDLHANVRVALHDCRTPHARSLMLAVEPGIRALARHGFVAGTPRRSEGSYHARPRVAWTGSPLVALREAHILLITVDALRADHLGAYGYRRGVSPALDAFAARNVVFEHAYAAAPHSSYSLTSLMTSEYLHEFVELGVPLPDATLANVLRANGYYTAAFFTNGIFHTEGERLETYKTDAFGFQRHQHDNPRAPARTTQVLAEADRIMEQGEPPSFIWAHYFDTHEPYLDTSLGASDMDRYDAEIRNVDRELERVITGIRARFSRPVVVVVTADHGEEFHEHGGVYHGSTLYDEQARVPLILSVEGIPGRRVAEPVELVDVTPTLLILVGVEPASSMRGEDLRPYAMGLTRRTTPVHAAVTHKRMSLEWPYKLIADLRFDLYELYNLDVDPGEHHNLASSDPERVGTMRADVYAWLDGIRANASRERDAWESALDLGRLRDRRAVAPLAELVANEEATTEPRVEAARLLGRFADPRSKPALVSALASHDPLVRAEVAIALGRIFDPAAREMLRSLVRSEDPGIRTRAGISLARLGDRGAVPSLLETLRISRDQFEREEAVRWLGRLGDAQAMEELIELLGDFRIRHLTVISLGQLHDPTAYAPLIDVLTWERHATIRNNVLRGLGELGDPRAIPTFVHAAWNEPELDFASESLIRVRAVARGAIGGIDFDTRAGRRLRTLRDCTDAAPDFEWLYVGKSHCRLEASSLTFPLRTPPSLAQSTKLLVLFRARSLVVGGAHVVLHVGGTEVGSVDLDDTMREYRFELETSAIRSGTTNARIDVGIGVGVTEETRSNIELDHLLILPRPAP